MTTTHIDADTQVWHVTGYHTCDVCGCAHDADIIADTDDHDRFCVDHTDIAALIPSLHRDFAGWYRVTASHYPVPGAGVTLTVHPL